MRRPGKDSPAHDDEPRESKGAEPPCEGKPPGGSGGSCVPPWVEMLGGSEEGSARWSAGTFAAKAKELSRRLSFWHIDDGRSLTPFVSERGARRRVRLIFREIISADPGPRPSRGLQVYWHEAPAEDGSVGESFLNTERDTDRSLTMWLMGDFLRHLQAAPPLPALDYLAESFGQLLDLPAWAVCEPELRRDYGHDAHGDPVCFQVTGREIPAAYLDALTVAAEHLLAQAPPAWGSGATEGERTYYTRNQSGQREKSKRHRGRKPDTDPKEDKRIAEAMKAGHYRTYAECALALGGGLTAKKF